MTCDRCGQPAVVRVAEASVEEWCCPACADVVAGGPWLRKIAEAMIRPRRRDGRCPHCGATQDSVRETGLVGCPLCYLAFDDEFLNELGIARQVRPPYPESARSDTW